jgi:predicted site-specific integrase-resolvase
MTAAGGNAMVTTQELLKAEELGARLKVSKGTVTRWRKAGLVPAICIGRAVYRYDFHAVLEALRVANLQTRKPEHAAV